MQEIWKDIYFIDKGIVYDYRGLYQISNWGRVKSLARLKPNCNQTGFTGSYKLVEEKILKPNVFSNEYCNIRLQKNGTKKNFRIHRLVAIHFIPNSENKPEVNHKDGNKHNNIVSNLEWCTAKENVRHSIQTNLTKRKYGKEHHNSIAVIQYDLEGNFIKYWECIADVTRETKINNSHIGSCCKGKQKTCGGYIWKYAKEQAC